MVQRLDKAEEAARQKLAEARQPIAEPARVQQARTHADDAARTARQAMAAEKAATALLERIEAEQPRGLLAWITGKTARHRQEMEAAKAAEREARTERKAQDSKAQVLDDVRRSVERKWTDERSGIEGKQAEQSRESMQELDWIDRARKALDANPGLADSPQALQRHIEEEARQAQEIELLRRAEEAARERQHDHGPGIGGPRM